MLICAPAVPTLLEKLGSNDPSHDSSLIVTIWNLGAIIGFFFIGPLSETYGRRPVYNGCNILFCVFQVGAALSTTVGMLIAFQFLNGLTVASAALNTSIVGDMFDIEQRGKAQSLVAVMPLCGPVLGPLIGGYMTAGLGWRAVFYFVAILVGIQELPFAIFFRETYEPLVLTKRAAQGQIEAENPKVSSRSNEADSNTLSKPGYSWASFLRPLKVFLIPTFLIPASCVAIIYGFVYILFTTISEVFQARYAFSTGASGLSFIGIGIGMATATYVCGATPDWHTSRMKRRHGGEVKPEWRLPLMVPGSCAASAGLLLYGWTAEAYVHWIVPILGTSFVGFSLSATAIPAITYLADTFGRYRASAIAAMHMYRLILTILLPLAGSALYNRLGMGWGNSVLAFISIVMIPVPILFLKFGERLRQKFVIESRL